MSADNRDCRRRTHNIPDSLMKINNLTHSTRHFRSLGRKLNYMPKQLSNR